MDSDPMLFQPLHIGCENTSIVFGLGFSNTIKAYKSSYNVKGAHSNICTKSYTVSQLIQYNNFKMRSLMRNCLKYTQQCQNGIKRTCRAAMVP